MIISCPALSGRKTEADVGCGHGHGQESSPAQRPIRPATSTSTGTKLCTSADDTSRNPYSTWSLSSFSVGNAFTM
ncbi:unnamed protein product [Protopolystoma xenopodis]|uniref:Uncharacterized protein n=1 Tax=Protopolystoma xenopodis TaxID=117903 RepID=A0A448XDP9_9PLAT|nr:unnamed protein product [Protopolystoma xenopodis]